MLSCVQNWEPAVQNSESVPFKNSAKIRSDQPRFSKKTYQLVMFNLCNTCVMSLFQKCFQIFPDPEAFCLAVVCWDKKTN